MNDPHPEQFVEMIDAVRPPRSKRAWPLALLGLAILVCGVIIGSGALVLTFPERLVRSAPAGERSAAIIAEDMRHRYGLTAEQASRVQEILSRRLSALETVRQEMQAKVEAEHDKLRAEMKQVLTPEQFERWSRELEARRPPPAGPPGGPPGIPGRPPDRRPGQYPPEGPLAPPGLSPPPDQRPPSPPPPGPPDLPPPPPGPPHYPPPQGPAPGPGAGPRGP